jgi:hypothetical protein
MSMPQFTAEMSIYRSHRQYRASGSGAGGAMEVALEQACRASSCATWRDCDSDCQGCYAGRCQ